MLISWRLLFEVLEHALNFNLPTIVTAKQVCRTEAIHKANSCEFLQNSNPLDQHRASRFPYGEKKKSLLYCSKFCLIGSFGRGNLKQIVRQIMQSHH